VRKYALGVIQNTVSVLLENLVSVQL